MSNKNPYLRNKFGQKARFQVYAPNTYTTPQLRDTSTPTHEIVLVAPSMGGQWATMQSIAEGKRLLQKVARLLNN